jgi:hypothetical protein
MSLPSTLFRTDVQRDVVRELVHAPAASRSATDLARALHRPASSVSRAVRDLAADGLLSTTARGRRQLLTPNYGHPAMRALREAVLRSDELDAERDRGVRWWQTMPELAAAVGEARESGDEDRALRLLLDGVNQIPLVAALEQLDDLLVPPGSTGDARWDALLAGAVRVHLHRLGPPDPGLDAPRPPADLVVAVGSRGTRRPGDAAHPSRARPPRHLVRRTEPAHGMSRPDPELSRADIVELLTEVGAFLADRGWRATIYVADGAAMALLFDARSATRDVDAVFRSDRGQLSAAIRHVADRHGLPAAWLNDQVAALVPAADDPDAVELVLPGLEVLLSSPRHLLAMTMLAGRDRDLDDLTVLFRELGVTEPGQAVRITEEVFGPDYPDDTPPVEYLHALAEDVLDRLRRAAG